LQRRGWSVALYLLWFALGLAYLGVVVPANYLGALPWKLPPEQMPQVYMLTTAYVMNSLLLFGAAREDAGPGLLRTALLAALCYGLCCGVLLIVPGLEISRFLVTVSVVLGIVVAAVPFLLGARMLAAATMVTALLVIVGTMRLLAVPRVDDGDFERLTSALHLVRFAPQEELVPEPEAMGGALEPVASGFLLVTGDGDFYHLDWSEGGEALTARNLGLSSPLVNRGAVRNESDLEDSRYRVTDLLVRESAGGLEVFVAHLSWDAAERCMTLAVSGARLGPAPDYPASDDEAWTEIYRTNPCVAPPFDTADTGGRLLWMEGGRFLLGVGSFGMNGIDGPGFAQDLEVDYGKVVLLDLAGNAQVYTRGHKSIEGLIRDNQGQIWSTELGPMGGDELNLLREGRNYGWPRFTYGTEYGELTWPWVTRARNHGFFAEPVLAFLPSVSVTNLIQVGDRQFPRWHGDLLLGAMREGQLYRVRTRNNRVVYVEPLPVGKGVRDLAEAPDGRLVLWSDDGVIQLVSRGPEGRTGEDLFKPCRLCHESVNGKPATAPSLRGVLGRPPGSVEDFAYSDALREAGGEWTEARLSEYLADPQVFAPGGGKDEGAVPDPTEREILVQYLKTYVN